MDFKKLAQVTDSVKGIKPVALPSNIDLDDTEVSPLNGIELRSKVKDEKSPKETPEVQKVIILDDKRIKKLFSLARTERNKFLAKLSDSQRRSVLERYKELTNIVDSKPSKVKDATHDNLDLVVADQLLANMFFSPTQFNIDNVNAQFDAVQYDENTVALKEHLLAGNPVPAEVLEEYKKTLGNDGTSMLIKALETEEPGDEEVPLPEAEVDASVAEDLENLGDSFSVVKLIDKVEDSITKITLKGHNYTKVRDAYLKSMNRRLTRFNNGVLVGLIEDSLGISLSKIRSRKILDEAIEKALDTIDENPFINRDGSEFQGTEDKSILTALNEALLAFAEGDPEKLRALSNQSITATTPDPDAEGAPEPKPEEEATAEELEDLGDSIKLAKYVISKEGDAQIVDKLRSKVSALRLYNFKIYDCELGRSDVGTSEIVVDVPVTRDEFANSYDNSAFVNLLASVQHLPLVEAPETVEISTPCVKVNNEYMFPYNCSAEELIAKLEGISKEDWGKIISDNACRLSDALRLAALTGNLHFIDNRFYKPRLSDSVWTFDEIPSCLKNVVDGKCKLKLHRGSATDNKVVNLFGQNYELC